jgi:hypothetical protein
MLRQYRKQLRRIFIVRECCCHKINSPSSLRVFIASFYCHRSVYGQETAAFSHEDDFWSTRSG